MLLAFEWSRTDRFATAWCGPAPGHRADQRGVGQGRVEPDGGRQMAAGEQELGSSFANHTLATGEAFGRELDGSNAEPPANRRDPVGEDGEGQRMGLQRRASVQPRPGSRLARRCGLRRPSGAACLSRARDALSPRSASQRPTPFERGTLVHCSDAWIRWLKARLVDAARRRGKSCRI
jgi:hypothetical protein